MYRIKIASYSLIIICVNIIFSSSAGAQLNDDLQDLRTKQEQQKALDIINHQTADRVNAVNNTTARQLQKTDEDIARSVDNILEQDVINSYGTRHRQFRTIYDPSYGWLYPNADYRTSLILASPKARAFDDREHWIRHNEINNASQSKVEAVQDEAANLRSQLTGQNNQNIQLSAIGTNIYVRNYELNGPKDDAVVPNPDFHRKAVSKGQDPPKVNYASRQEAIEAVDRIFMNP